MNRIIYLPLLVVILITTRISGQIDSTKFSKSVVSIIRYFPKRLVGNDTIYGFRATAWFYRKRKMVTIGHFTESDPKIRKGWQKMVVHHTNKFDTIWIKVSKKIEAHENLILLKTKNPVPYAETLKIQKTPLLNGSNIYSFVYSKGSIGRIEGIFHRMATNADELGLGGLGLIETWSPENQNRLMVDFGSSGSPIFSSEGKVVGILNKTLTKQIKILGEEIRVSTPWGEPNNSAVMIFPLFSLKKIK